MAGNFPSGDIGDPLFLALHWNPKLDADLDGDLDGDDETAVRSVWQMSTTQCLADIDGDGDVDFDDFSILTGEFGTTDCCVLP